MDEPCGKPCAGGSVPGRGRIARWELSLGGRGGGRRQSRRAAIVDVTLPAGAFGGSGTAGWKTNKRGTAFAFVDRSGAPANGIRRLKVRVGTVGPSASEVRLVVKGTGGSYPDPVPPFEVQLEFGPEHCFATSFITDPSDPTCSSTPKSLICP
jgi:hypothetical protein